MRLIKHFGVAFSLILIIIASFFVVYYFTSMHIVDTKNIYNELENEKKKWKELNISDYSFKISNVNTGGIVRLFNSTMIIKNNNVDKEIQEPYRYYYDSSGVNFWEPFLYTVSDNFPEYCSIDNIYSDTENYIKSNYKNKIDLKNGYCRNIIIKYDDINHIPIEITFEFWFNPLLNVTDRLSYYTVIIEDFKKL